VGGAGTVTSAHCLHLGGSGSSHRNGWIRASTVTGSSRVVSTALPAPAPTHAAKALQIYAREWRRGRTHPRRLSRAPTAGLADGSALVLEKKESTATQSGKGPPKGQRPGNATSKCTGAILNVCLNHCVKATGVGGWEGAAAGVDLGG